MIRGANEVRLEDVLVGEVWLCAGQSNMLLPLAKADDAKREIAAATHPRLRFLAIRTAAGGSPTEAWIGRDALSASPPLAPLVRGDWTRNPALAGWCVERAGQNLARAWKAGVAIPGDALGPAHPFKPGFLHDACIAPLVPLVIRGVPWYQGESNADSPARVAQHALLLPTLVASWRREWGRDDLPFAIVQLPGMDRPDWPAFRETQRRAVKGLAHTGLVVTIDLGRKGDVHPPDKRPVGERIARWALAEAHGRDAAARRGGGS